MSFRPEIFKQNNGLRFTRNSGLSVAVSDEETLSVYLEVLYNGVHGFCFSPYEEGQKPGDMLTEAQIRKRLSILKKHTSWIRSFSCTEGNELIPIIAKEFGLKTLVGAWLGKDEEKNRAEIAALVKLANNGYVDIAAVGNEVLYRKELTEEALLETIKAVKQEIINVPVGYVDAYYEFVQRPKITAICDIILCNCYPYWEGTSNNDALPHMQTMYQQALAAGGGKKVIITETGWPSQGKGLGGALPSEINAMRYFIDSQLWAHDEQIELFYFSSFDESWKVGDEGDVGAHWGIWNSSEKLKFTNEYV